MEADYPLDPKRGDGGKFQPGRRLGRVSYG